MSLATIPYPIVTLDQALAPLQSGKLLQQGWSPRCHSQPANGPDQWGVLKTTAIQPGAFNSNENKALPDSMDPRPHIVAHSGDLIMTNAGPRSRCGVPALIRDTQPRRMLSGKMYRFRANDHFDPEFLELWLLSPVAQKQIDQMKTGISDSGLNLTQSRFLRLPVPQPTLAEQRQIVCQVQQHMISMEAALATVRHAKVQTNIWRASAINDRIFSGETWGHLALKDLLREPMRNGRSDRVSMDSASSTRCLTLTAVTQSQFSEGNTKLTSTPPEVATNLWLEPGDILVQRSNTPELVGTTARYDGPRNWSIFPDLLIRIRCDETIIDSRFLATVMRTERVHRFFRSRAKGLSGSMPKIDQDTVGITRIPVPPMDVQRNIVAATVEITDQANAMAQTLKRTERRAESLRNSVLVAAFEGRLTQERQPIVVSDNAFSQNLNLVSEAL